MWGDRTRLLSRGLLACAAIWPLAAANAQDMVYQPNDPTFGGNPFNSAHLLGIANAQNTYKDPNSGSSSSQADIFARQLQSRLLSALSSQIVDAIFGASVEKEHLRTPVLLCDASRQQRGRVVSTALGCPGAALTCTREVI